MEIRLKIKEVQSTQPATIILSADEKAVRHAIATFGMTNKGRYTAFVLDKIRVAPMHSERCTLEKKSEKELAKMTVASNPIAIIFDEAYDKVEIVVASHGKAI